ncbi:MAG: signal peptide peptidase SppA [bacterium]|nr:signal peptide peptidase SppA [bacterium]
MKKSDSKAKILVIDLKGTITSQAGGILDRGGDPVSNIYYRLKLASQDPRVKGIILRLDTPGGDVTASDIIYKEILRFKEKTGAPVVALMMGVAASGGYYAASACDTIMAHPTTITGSIGVIAVLPGVKKVLDKVGIQMNVIKSGKMKDAGSPFKEINEDEKAYFQEMVDNFYNGFIQAVHRSRKEHLSIEEIKKLADGRVYHAQKALKLKLIDSIGYFDDALEKVLSMASIRDAKVIAYTYHPLKKTNIYANAAPQGNPFSVEIKPFENLVPTLKTGFYYLWLPEL